MIKFFQTFVRITGWIVYKLFFRTRVFYEDKKEQGRKIRGGAIIVSNHTAVFDFAQMLFLFPGRTLRYVMAEILMNRKILGKFLKLMGGIKVDRDAYDFAFLYKCEEILERGGVVGIFPEGRLPRKEEERPLPFKASAAYIALRSGAPIIPVYTDGKYFVKGHANVIIGKKLYSEDLTDPLKSEKEQIADISVSLREKILELKDELEQQKKGSKKQEMATV